jgi:hypothetical protein
MQEASGYCGCGDCIFWDHAQDGEGLCRRHAPTPSQKVDEVAHWPETRAENGCGEGAPVAERRPVKCADCIYWNQPSGGLNPQRRRDETADWWRHGGHCLRLSPQPSPEPGARGFWRATSGNDSCGDGKARAPN